VILLKTIQNLGQSGEIKEVKEGYARNFLIPNGLAKIVTDKTLKELENLKAKKLKAEKNKGKKYKGIARKLDNLKLIINAKADESKTLFGSINANKIAEELKNRGYSIEAKFIKLEQPIKQLGYYDVLIDFGSDEKAKIGLTIEREV
ncbi:MAG TPA: 50S ribosomal protein L9, partial [Candidatus Uhrbacteria bacterium]|nr:50S ribosomal protein L9 [Candidatus Uhrbacteria bacterium]